MALQDQLTEAVAHGAHGDEARGAMLADYWSSRIDETSSSDVLGILNMGPAAAIGLIGYFRWAPKQGVHRPGKRCATQRTVRRLHIRPYIVRAFSQLRPSDCALLAKRRVVKVVLDETMKDVQQITLAGSSVTPEKAKQSAQIVAKTIATFKAPSLEEHALGEIQPGGPRMIDIVRRVRTMLVTIGDLPDFEQEHIFATHMVAAAVTEALATAPTCP
jgi:hypothetical protein